MAQSPPPEQPASPPHPADDATSLLVGHFRFTFADEVWEWSAETAQIHGYPVEEMRPSTDQVLSHKHPDDHAAITATVKQIRRTHESINTRHRIVDVQGRTREVVVVGQQLCDDAGVVVGTHGYYVDVTPTVPVPGALGREHDLMVTQAVAEVTKRRSVIEQVKGMLMLVYRIDAERAFEILRWRSQLTNTKLLSLAHQLLEDFAAIERLEDLPTRTVFDELLLTAHTRTTHPLAS
jgi:hypothetical protein